MATNKRKEAAALFELIDKSTLKIPKNAGALKIPAWWSSKTNPAAPAGPEPAAASASVRPVVTPKPTPAPSAPSSPPVSQASSPLSSSPSPAVTLTFAGSGEASASAERAEISAEPAAPPAQARLFDPPPEDERPASSPSIRPPSAVKRVPVTPAVKASPAAGGVVGAGASSAAAAVQGGGGGGGSAKAEPAAREGTRVFAPQTHSQSRRPWSAPRPGAFARVPGWVYLALVAGFVVILGIVFVVRSRMSGTSTAPAQGPTRANVPAAPAPVSGGTLAAPGPATRTLLPPVQGVPTVPPMAPAGTRGGAAVGHSQAGAPVAPVAPAAPVAPGQAGKVNDAGGFNFEADKYYVVICTTPSATIARRNADWLAEKGVDVTIEPIKSSYRLIATRPFGSNSEAVPFRKQIVDIGDAHIRNAWADAFIRKGAMVLR